MVVLRDPAVAEVRGIVERLDGNRVAADREYRVKPGEHTVIIRFRDSLAESYAGLGLGSMPASQAELTLAQPSSTSQSAVPGSLQTLVPEPGRAPGAGTTLLAPGQFQLLKLNMKAERASYFTNTFIVEPGWRYELDGSVVTKRRFAQP